MAKAEKWRSTLRFTLASCFFIALSALSGYLGFNLPGAIQRATPVWIHTGIYLAVYCQWQLRALPIIAVSSFITNYIYAGRPLWFCTILMLTHFFGAHIGRSILLPLKDLDQYRLSYSEIPRITLAALATPFLNAVLGSTYVARLGNLTFDDFVPVFATWLMGMSLGILLVTPVVLEWFKQQPTSRRAWINFGLFVVTAAPVVYVILFTTGGHAWLFGLFPLLLAGAWVLPRKLFLTAVLMLNIAALAATSLGVGPFRGGTLTSDVQSLQIFLGTVSLTTLALEVFRQNASKLVPLITLLTGWVLSGAIYFMFINRQRSELLAEVERIATIMTGGLVERIDTYGSDLHLVRTFFKHSTLVGEMNWKSLVSQIDLDARVPSLQAIGVVFDAAAPQLSLVHALRARANLAKPDAARASPPRSSSLDVASQDFANVVGLDTPRLGSVADVTRTCTAFPHGTPKLFLGVAPASGVQQAPESILLCLSLDEQAVASVDSSSRPSGGFVFEVLNAQRFFNSALSSRTDELAVEIFSGDATRSGLPLFVSAASPMYPKDPYDLVTTTMLADQLVAMGWRRSLSFSSRYDLSAVILSSTTTLLTLLLAGMVANLQMVGERAERIAIEKSRELDKQKVIAIHSAKMVSLGEMAGGIAHEINNPLAIIHGMSQLLREECTGVSPEDVIAKIQLIEQTTLRISKIIAGLRTFSRSGEGDPFEVESLTTIIEQSLALCRERFNQAGITLRVSPIPDVEIDCRATQISQIILNLLSNAFDAVGTASDRWAELRCEDDHSHVAIRVANGGPKIPESLRERIFQPFFTTKDSKHGTGLGLSISKSIAEAHGGELRLDDEAIHTCFVLDLPKLRERPTGQARRALPPPPA